VKLSDIGEFGLIELLAREIGVEYPPRGSAPPPGLLVPLGDDAVVTERRDAALIWTTDTLVAGEHFLQERSGWDDVGWKALAVNVSDVAAMGGKPHLALVTLMLPAEFCVDDALALYRGLHECGLEYGVAIGGGDIVRSPVFAVTVALSGRAYSPRLGQPILLRRDAARPGDLVAVSGTLGDSAGGVKLLVSGRSSPADDEHRLLDAQRRPQPRVALGEAALRCGLRCGIDVSDGLVQDLGHVARASRAGIQIEAGKVPVSEALRRVWPEDALRLALTGGEDYELIVIGPAPAMEHYVASAEGAVTVIGKVTAEEGASVRVIDASGREMGLARGGWDHFAPT
jgi:thiamine-monophosphate kinase